MERLITELRMCGLVVSLVDNQTNGSMSDKRHRSNITVFGYAELL